RHWGFHTITAVAIPQTHAQRYPAISAHAETQEHLFEIVPPIFAMPIGRAGRSWSAWIVRIRSIERNGRGILMQPRGRDSVDLQRFERDGAKHLVEGRVPLRCG